MSRGGFFRRRDPTTPIGPGIRESVVGNAGLDGSEALINVWEGILMSHDDRDILHLLKLELAFLENGGYKRSARAPWKPTTLFLDSPICPNFYRPNPAHSCQECQLIQLVPSAKRDVTCPCHHIPLNGSGETLDSLYRWGTQEERKKVLRNWLREAIGRIERERFSKKCA